MYLRGEEETAVAEEGVKENLNRPRRRRVTWATISAPVFTVKTLSLRGEEDEEDDASTRPSVRYSMCCCGGCCCCCWRRGAAAAAASGCGGCGG
mmetsp:Transcript_35456/g.65664  ORF Transcript_35456/g.65664 Transcript_35456/m.65664 type:complete len:94 (+) Transcript_35456:769-1050(+)